MAPEGERFSARWTGRKMPAPGMVVLKYFVLQCLRSVSCACLPFCVPKNIPFDITVILPLCRKLPIQLDTDETSRLSPHTANEAHCSIHLSRDIDHVADLQVAGHVARSDGGGAAQSVQ